jgi:AcrR family transcriptional regulator
LYACRRWRHAARSATAPSPPSSTSAAAADSRQRLLRAGLAIARRSGLRAVTVRGLTRRAGANLGSFVHFFGTRTAFLDEMVEGWYAPLLQLLQLTLDDRGPVLQRLRQFCRGLVQFLVEHRVFISHVLLDAAAGEKPALRFVRTLPSRHPAMLLRLIAEAQADGGIDAEAEAEPLHVMLFMLGSLALLVVALTAAGRAPLLPAAFAGELERVACDPGGVTQRLDWMLAGLRPAGLAPDRGGANTAPRRRSTAPATADAPACSGAARRQRRSVTSHKPAP